MASLDKETRNLSRFGDRSTSDVVVRIRTQEGRDEWLYCHSHILIENSMYFADRLSENWPTCQILDSRNCVEVHCQESDFDYNVSLLRLLYDVMNGCIDDICHGVRNSLGILRASVEIGCEKIITACVNYLEAVPWEEAEEEEILKIIPRMGSQAAPILSRLQPVNPTAVVVVFLSAIRFATSSPPATMKSLKTSAQEQLEYMLTEDDDAPLLIANDEIKSEVRRCVKQLLTRFNNLLESVLCNESHESEAKAGKVQVLQSYLSDLLWACQISTKLETMTEFITYWMEASAKILSVVEHLSLKSKIPEIKFKVIEVAAKVLDAIGYGAVILPTEKRLYMVKAWLPFVRVTKPLIDSVTSIDDDALACNFDSDIWQSLEATFVAIILALPSMDQAEILTEWLGDEHVRYPDLTEAFEVWCYRSKVAKRRLTSLGNTNDRMNSF